MASELRTKVDIEENEVEVRVWTSHGTSWCAKVTGYGPKGFERSFCKTVRSEVSRSGKNGSKWVELLGTGLYEVQNPDTGLYGAEAREWFVLHQDGRVEPLTKKAAVALAKSMQVVF